MRIAQLTDQVGGPQQRGPFVDGMVFGHRREGEARVLDRACDQRAVDLLNLREPIQREELRPFDVIWRERGVGDLGVGGGGKRDLPNGDFGLTTTLAVGAKDEAGRAV